MLLIRRSAWIAGLVISTGWLAWPAIGVAQSNGICYVDTACSAGNQQRVRDSGSGLCVNISSCAAIWKCSAGPVTGNCGGGSQDCTFSPGCGEAVQDCFNGFCTSLSTCRDRIKYQGYSFTPTANQCSCAGNPPPADPACSTGCVNTTDNLCLGNTRFKVEATWRTSQGTQGNAKAVQLTSDTGYFWFFGSTNVEMVVKVLNACTLQPARFWVFAGGLTNVEVTMTVTDTATGAVRRYTNPQGRAFQPILDTDAFATCP